MVYLQARQSPYGRARGDKNAIGLQLLCLAVLTLYLDLLGLHEAAYPGKDLDLVLPHQALHALLQRADDPIPVLGELLVVELDAVGAYPKIFAVVESVEQLGGME